MNHDRSATLLVRVWLESGTDAFRARLTSVDTSSGSQRDADLTVGVASSPEDVLTIVNTWLTGFLGPGGQLGPAHS